MPLAAGKLETDMRVKFTAPFDYAPAGEPFTTIEYLPDGGPAGDGVYTVKAEAGEKAVALGLAQVEKPVKGEDAGA